MLSRAAYSVAIPLYSALITEVSPYFSDQTVSFEHCEETDIVNNEGRELNQLRSHGHQLALL